MPTLRATLSLIALLTVFATALSAQSLVVIPIGSLVPAPSGTFTVEPPPPPFGGYQSYDTTGNILFGSTVSVSGTLAGYPTIHNPAFLADGNYGNGRSWIGNSANSWIQFDLPATFTFDSVLFGRDRVNVGSTYNDRDPGQFTVQVFSAGLWSTVFDSSTLAPSFNGLINGTDTLKAVFASPVTGEKVKLTFANNGAAIDEVAIIAIPEPSTYAAIFGLLTLGLVQIRRFRQKSLA